MGHTMEDSLRRVRPRLSVALALVTAACCAHAGPLQDAEKELFAARYNNAAKM